MNKSASDTDLINRISASTYLRRLLENNNEDLSVIDCKEEKLGKQQLREALQSIIDQFEQGFQASIESTIDDSAMLYLRKQKQHFTVLWSVASLSGCLDFQEAGSWWTRFADASIDFALRAAWRSPEIQNLCSDIPEDFNQQVPGLFILGLGKLGGKDLNFSSDIDLVAFYDADLVPVSRIHGKTDVCTRILKRVTRLLSEQTGEGFVWRVDWRLRPEASVTPLAISVSAALQFYYFRSLSWHRLAMIKARVVAGDSRCGDLFLTEMDSYIWRINLDFTAFDELAQLKKKINLEHPGLQQARHRNHSITEDCLDFNLKLGRGGIREIEFIVNAMQLIWGGRHVVLRNPNTLQTLQQLVKLNLVESDIAEQLKTAYQLFRRTENAVQMLDNQQQYRLPSDPEKQQDLLHLLAIRNWSDLTELLFLNRQFVAGEFDACFADNDADESSHINTECLLDNELTVAARDIVNAWNSGFQIYGVANVEADTFTQLFEYLAEEITASGQDPSEAIVAVDAFFRTLPVGSQYFRLLKEHPMLLRSMIRPLLLSGPMATLLHQSPHIIDVLITHDHQHPDKMHDRSGFILQNTQIEIRAERLRRFVNEELYVSYLQLMRAQLTTTQLHERLTAIAENTLNLALQVNCENMQMDNSPIAILGLGKLGMKSMAPLSDLDLIFIAESLEQIEPANRFARRLQHLMETRMKEGIAYEMDMRLRPSGRSGPPTVSLGSFQKYHLHSAQTWEHIALVPGRYVTGQSAIGQQVTEIRHRVLTQARDQQQCINDAWKMLDRIREQRITDSSRQNLAIKLRPGGLMETDYLCACLALMKLPDNPEWVRFDYSGLVQSLSGDSDYRDLYSIVQFWRCLQVWIRLFGEDEMPVTEFPQQEMDLLLEELKLESPDHLLEKISDCAETITHYLDRLMESRSIRSKADIDSWQEMPVQWQ
ncbi:MAG: hypothetical protein K0U68_14395 [Gammaproteobacteria bacterium]|nr:hypothetical protein [Gammaproteobacteria bacterium]